MKKQDIISFFDECAPRWDNDLIRNDKVINKILDNGGIEKGVRVLDVACGTGVLFPDYIKRGAVVTAVDISHEMVKIAKKKFPDINIICGDVEEIDFAEKFDSVMIYNAFPHFPNPQRLIERLSALLREGGRLSVAHGMSREALQKHHSGKAKEVSLELPEAQKLAKIFAPYFKVDVIISDNEMYQVSGIKNNL
ncbi:MAG: class I SAM-dependent methyltransferase [Clostridia bacterium]|nr:class I SAM-dependent methyltransferase [Clostridia bacterium]